MISGSARAVHAQEVGQLGSRAAHRRGESGGVLEALRERAHVVHHRSWSGSLVGTSGMTRMRALLPPSPLSTSPEIVSRSRRARAVQPGGQGDSRRRRTRARPARACAGSAAARTARAARAAAGGRRPASWTPRRGLAATRPAAAPRGSRPRRAARRPWRAATAPRRPAGRAGAGRPPRCRAPVRAPAASSPPPDSSVLRPGVTRRPAPSATCSITSANCPIWRTPSSTCLPAASTSASSPASAASSPGKPVTCAAESCEPLPATAPAPPPRAAAPPGPPDPTAPRVAPSSARSARLELAPGWPGPATRRMPRRAWASRSALCPLAIGGMSPSTRSRIWLSPPARRPA